MSWPNKVWPERIACAEKNAMNIAGTLRLNVIAPKTPALAQRTGSRFGTAVNVARIIPGRVLARDHENAEDPDRELRHVDADQRSSRAG